MAAHKRKLIVGFDCRNLIKSGCMCKYVFINMRNKKELDCITTQDEKLAIFGQQCVFFFQRFEGGHYDGRVGRCVYIQILLKWGTGISPTIANYSHYQSNNLPLLDQSSDHVIILISYVCSGNGLVLLSRFYPMCVCVCGGLPNNTYPKSVTLT